MAIKVIDGNLFDTEADYLCHQVNCQGKMGSGVAKQIKERYPLAYMFYKKWCDDCTDSSKLLGQTQIVMVSDGATRPMAVCNLFAQDMYGYNGKCYTSYTAFQSCLLKLKAGIPPGSTIAMPYKIGCGLGGGDWTVVLKMIEKTLGDAHTVELWRLEQ